MNQNEATGVLTEEELGNIIPPIERLKKGPVVMIECVESIPCDPCKEACPFGAILKNSLITPPIIDWDKCTGCGICVGACPGLAIFVIDMSQPRDKGLITIPYELLPVPKIGERVVVLDRKGETLGTGQIHKTKIFEDHTAIVTIAVNKKIALNVRNIR